MDSRDRTFHQAAAAGTAASLALLLAWDTIGLDVAVAHFTSGFGPFTLRDHWLFSRLLHDWARAAVWVLVLWPVAALWKPVGVLRRLPRPGIVWLLATTLSGMLVVSLLKSASLTSCPWDLNEFGGVARHVSHWAWGMGDGGPGHCFPGGHASAGFAWVAGYFAFRRDEPRIARRWLIAALAAGALMGLAQQLRGAHFTSHTLWTAWLCWTWAWGCSLLAFPNPHAAAAGRG